MTVLESCPICFPRVSGKIQSEVDEKKNEYNVNKVIRRNKSYYVIINQVQFSYVA